MGTRRISIFIAVIVVLAVFLPHAVFAGDFDSDAALIAKTMRAYQGLYRHLYESDLLSYSSPEYIAWPGFDCGGAAAPPFPPDDFYLYRIQSEDDAIVLTKSVVHPFLSGSTSFYGNFVKPEYSDIGGTDVSTGDLNYRSGDLSGLSDSDIESDYRGVLNSLYSIITQDLKYMKVSANFRNIQFQSSGHDSPSCNCNEAHSEANSNWPGSWESGSAYTAIGQTERSASSDVHVDDPADNPCGSGNDYISYSASLSAARAEINANLTKYNGSAKCYIQIQPAGVGYSNTNGMTEDSNWQEWGSPKTGQEWTSDSIADSQPQFETSCPDPGEKRGWHIKHSFNYLNHVVHTAPVIIVKIDPGSLNQTNNPESLPRPQTDIFKQDDTAYSANPDCDTVDSG